MVQRPMRLDIIGLLDRCSRARSRTRTAGLAAIASPQFGDFNRKYTPDRCLHGRGDSMRTG